MNLCHDLSHNSLQTCLIHPTNARSFIDTLSTQTTLSFLHRDSRLCHGSNRRRLDGDPPHPTVFISTSFSSGVRNSKTASLIQLGIPIVSVRKLHKHSLHVAINTGPPLVEGLRVHAIEIPQLGFAQVVTLVWFSLMMATCLNNCTSVSGQHRAFNISISCHS